jgi:CRP-like cAMP-binding protein
MQMLIDAHDVKPVGVGSHRNFLIRKLSHFVSLSALDEKFLDTLALPDERFPAHTDIVVEGGPSRSGFLIKEGTAIRYRDLPDGGRQIMTFLIPGDLCDGHVFLAKTMDYSIGTITPVCIAPVSHEIMMEIFSYRRRICAAIWWSWLQEQAILRERLVSLGRRDARGRVAYLLCELLWRYAAVGLADGGRFRLRLTQAQLGDALGLTPVRINHVLKEFKLRSLLAVEHRLIHLLDVASLQQIAGLSRDYLQLGGAPGEMAPYLPA